MRGDLQEQKSPKHSCFTRACPSMSDSSQTWEPGAPCTAWRQVMKLEGALSGCLSWCKRLVGSSHGSASSRHLVWYQSLPCSLARLRVFFVAQLLLLTFPGKGLMNLVSFRVFLKPQSYLPLDLSEFPVRMQCFTSPLTFCALNFY